jgi:hypothetical protein
MATFGLFELKPKQLTVKVSLGVEQQPAALPEFWYHRIPWFITE